MEVTLSMTMVNPTERRLAALRMEHRNLDTTIAEMAQDRTSDELELQRLKKRKLFVKDTIFRLEGGAGVH